MLIDLSVAKHIKNKFNKKNHFVPGKLKDIINRGRKEADSSASFFRKWFEWRKNQVACSCK